MAKHDNLRLMTLALELRLAAREHAKDLNSAVPTSRIVEIAEAIEVVSRRIDFSDRREGGISYCAWD